MTKEIWCGIIPLYKNSDGEYEVLLIRNKRGRHRWFPKWHQEPWETLLETAIRETHEESGLTFSYIDEKIFEDQYTFTRKEESITNYVNYFIGIAQDNIAKIDPVEIKDALRLPLHEVKKKLTFYNDRQLRDKVLKYLQGK